MINSLLADHWKWTEIKDKINPGGIEIDTLNYHFQFVDWNKDGFKDINVTFESVSGDITKIYLIFKIGNQLVGCIMRMR